MLREGDLMVCTSDGSPRVKGAQLRRGLNMWEAIGLSLAAMAPSAVVNINPQGHRGALYRWP